MKLFTNILISSIISSLVLVLTQSGNAYALTFFVCIMASGLITIWDSVSEESTN